MSVDYFVCPYGHYEPPCSCLECLNICLTSLGDGFELFVYHYVILLGVLLSFFLVLCLFEVVCLVSCANVLILNVFVAV